MHYLIDGHNLIAKMPDISLKDPDDEVQLILRLRSWTAASKKRQVTVYFDGGIPGGKNVKLSTPPVRVIFAASGTPADVLLIKRIQKVKNPPEYTLVTSDQQIIAAATARRLNHLRSEKFSMRLAKRWEDTPPGPTLIDDDPVISEVEIQEWLTTFGPVDQESLRNRPKPIPPNQKIEEIVVEEPESFEPASNNREDPEMSSLELQEWLTLFNSAPKPEPKKAKEQARTASPASPKRKKRPNPHELDQNDLDAWQEFVNRTED